jgi:hypothetical protein
MNPMVHLLFSGFFVKVKNHLKRSEKKIQHKTLLLNYHIPISGWLLFAINQKAEF